MSTEILVKEIIYSSFEVEDTITPQTFDEKYDTIIETFGEGDSSSFDSETEFALNMDDFNTLPEITLLNESNICDQEIRIEQNSRVSKILRLHKDNEGHIELHILDRKGNLTQVVTL